MCKIHRLADYQKHLGPQFTRLMSTAAGTDRIEGKFRWRAKQQFKVMRSYLDQAFDHNSDVTVTANIDWLDDLLLQHMRATLTHAYKGARREHRHMGGKVVRLSRYPDPKVPRSLRELVKVWDDMRKRDRLSARSQRIFDKVKKTYLKRVQSIWDRYGNDWRSGETNSKALARDKLDRLMNQTSRRVKMVIETETTYYNNKARRAYYDAAPEVTHYLYLAVRDHATTPWCKSRHGMVFVKGTKLLENNTPPIHWNCRSEIVPLTLQNPVHYRMIMDPKRDPTKHKLVALPKGWGNRAA